MDRILIRKAPAEVVRDDEHRFGRRRIHNLIQQSGLALDARIAELYCRWFVGSDYGWRSSWTKDRYDASSRPRRFSTAQLADHLAQLTSAGGRCYSLHTQCKATQLMGKRFYWTPFLAVDLDDKGTASQPLTERYQICVDLFGEPLVILTPNRGLHVYWPLAQPVSVLGFAAGGRLELPVVVPEFMAAQGLVVAAGNVEVFPSTSKTLRLPLGATSVQLDAATLKPLPVCGRAEQVTRLVETMEHLARTTPLNALALVERHRNLARRPVPAGIRGRPSQHLRARRVDVQKLLTQGLYVGVSRNEAALALVRYWMLFCSLDEKAVVDRLMDWTARRTNGLSKEARDLSRLTTYRKLQREYMRMCRNLEKHVRSGRMSVKAGGFLTTTDAERIFSAGSEHPSGRDRYWMEVFACCLIGFAKRNGASLLHLRSAGDVQQVQVELAASMMIQWPRCAGSGYKKRLGWAQTKGLATLSRRHRPPRQGQPGRARTYVLSVDTLGPLPLTLDPAALVRGAELLVVAGHRRLHPQQVEHALLAVWRYGSSLMERYGTAATQHIRTIAAAYDRAREEGKSTTAA